MNTKRPPRDNVYRASFPGLEVRAGSFGEASPPTLTGHFAVTNQWAEIASSWEGDFLERIAPGAFKKTFAENRGDMRVLFQHGRDPQIGDKPLGPIEMLSEDDTGAYYEVPMIDTSYNRDLLPGLEAGLYGASFRFKVMRESIVDDPGVSASNPKGMPERTIKEAQVMEFGPVTFPAYTGATAGVRSITDTIRDVDAMTIATPILLDEERLGRAQVFVSRGIPKAEEEPVEKPTVEEIREKIAEIRAMTMPVADMPAMDPAAMDDMEPMTMLDGDAVEAIGSLIEVIESACEAVESLLGIDDDTGPDADDPAGRSKVQEDAPPVDSAEPSLAHPIRGRRESGHVDHDVPLFGTRKEPPSWQLPSRNAVRGPRKSTLG
jgi:HK97 family phage prohead protease